MNGCSGDLTITEQYVLDGPYVASLGNNLNAGKKIRYVNTPQF